jgi:hypothetical protein
LAGRRRNPLVDRDIFDSRSIKRSSPIRHFENIPVKLVAGLKKIVIGDFRPVLVHRSLPSIYDAQHMGATEMNLLNLRAGCGGSRCTPLICQSYPTVAAIHRF